MLLFVLQERTQLLKQVELDSFVLDFVDSRLRQNVHHCLGRRRYVVLELQVIDHDLNNRRLEDAEMTPVAADGHRVNRGAVTSQRL